MIRLRSLIGMLAIGLVLGACGEGPPTTTGGDADDRESAATDDAATDDEEAATGWDEVYAEIAGLEGQERTDRLVELAEDAGGVIRFYSTMNGDEGFALVDAFNETYGLEVDFYRASARNVAQRTVQEYNAGYDNSADVISASGTEMVILDREGVFAEFNSPVHDEYPEIAVESDGQWVWVYATYFTPVWNTELVSPDEEPETWMDVLTNFGGRCVFESKAHEWLASLIPHLMQEEGLSEDEATDLVRDAAEGCIAAVSGQSLVTNLVASGEYDISFVTSHHSVRRLMDDGAPVAWFDPPAVVFGSANGVSPNALAPNPAGGLLFAEFMLSPEGGQIIAEFGRSAAHPDVELGAIDPGYTVISADLEGVIDEAEHWEGLYEELNTLAGGVIED